MKGDIIPNEEHIARFCRPSHVSNGEVQATAFMVRQIEDSLSVNWLEFLNCSNRSEEIAEIRKIYSKKLKVGQNTKIAVLNVGEVCGKVLTESPDSRVLKVLHNPSGSDQSHSGIYNYGSDDELIAELILETVGNLYPGR